MTPMQARILQRHAPDVDGYSEICRVLYEIVTALFPPKDGKKKAAPKNREEAMVERFGGIQMPSSAGTERT